MYRFPLTRKHDQPSKLPELLYSAQIYQKVLQIIDVLYPTYTISDFCKISNFRITIRIFGEFFREFKYCESAISCMLNINSWNRDVMAAVVWWWIYIKLYNQYMSNFLASSQLTTSIH
jgi:hypothetical protein